MDEPEVLYAVDESIATITLNAADRLNALSEPMLRGLADAAARAQDDPAARAYWFKRISANRQLLGGD